MILRGNDEIRALVFKDFDEAFGHRSGFGPVAAVERHLTATGLQRIEINGHTSRRSVATIASPTLG